MATFEDILKANKSVLMMGTALVLAGCGSTTTADVSHNDMQDTETTELSSTASVEVEADDNDYSGEDLGTKRLMRIAAHAYKKGNTGTAMQLYAMAGQKDPNNPEPALAMADLLRKSKKVDGALDLYKRISARFPEIAEPHTGIGYILLTQDKPYMAAKAFEAAVEIDPENAKSLGGLALALDTAGEHDKAHGYYRLAIQQAPNNLTYQNNLALSLALTGRTDQAIALLKVVTAHPKATAQHRQNLALVYGMAGKAKEAMKYSRMDLSESAARNNAMYFEALNGTPSQNNAATAVARAKKEAPKSRSVASKPLEQESYIGTNDAEQDLSTEPVVVAKEDTAASSFVDRKRREIDLARASVAPSTEPTAVAAAPSVSVEVQKMAEPKVAQKAEPVRKIIEPVAKKPEVVKQEITARVDARETVAENIKLEKAVFKSPTVSFKKPSGDNLYFLQLASFRSKERAMRGWEEISQSQKDLIGEYSPVYAVTDLGPEKGVYYRVRIGSFTSRQEPIELCETLQANGQDCYLSRVPLNGGYTTVAAAIKSEDQQSSVPPRDYGKMIAKTDLSKELSRSTASIGY
ncbi:tetratricopeptide repeat protein [Sneathiella sp. P13V-1]|uniref:SPOR domain-containing protein n=1 Tax=Sneathiella sp. P13V-1 TaxID=2697366 RepID=UPI00187B6DE7|nr:tetratricopeptide repeat protein [Sneathiella sp. P13V-1]MBE7637210.1 tetratricopeptide repeat protein [Sneathiella sp. P13V-1]